MRHEHPQSTAKIGGHPIHPMLVLFPIAFLVANLFCDVAYWITGASAWAVAAIWLLGAALAMAALAAVTGFIDFFGDERVRALSDAWQHMIGNVVAVLLALVSFGIRLTYGIEVMIVPWGLALSLAIVLILVFTGWKGGELAYRHGVGVTHGTSGTVAGGPEDRSSRSHREAA